MSRESRSESDANHWLHVSTPHRRVPVYVPEPPKTWAMVFGVIGWAVVIGGLFYAAFG